MAEKKYVIDNAELMAEWNWEKNNELGFDPETLTLGSHTKAWWKCSKGHEWQAAVNSRNSGRGCPVCAGKTVIPGYNDLASKNPELAKEWHPTKNGTLTPYNVTFKSNKKVWWHCKNGHEWQAKILSRAYGSGCPFCAGIYVVTEVNDLESQYPFLAKEWHPTKNKDLTPRDVTKGSDRKVWWLGECGHEWKASISNRARGTGCPICKSESKTSFPEQAILFYCKKVTEAESRRICYGKEIDIYLPKLSIGIEFNGYFHKDKNRDDRKVEFFKEKGIRIISVYGKDDIKNNKICGDTIEFFYQSINKSSLNWAISAVFNLIDISAPIIDVKADEISILEQYIQIQKANSLLNKNPELAKEWHPTKNGNLTPDMVTAGSHKKVWWLGKCGHEWQAIVLSRSSGIGCPICAGKTIIVGENDLTTKYPPIAKEWHPTKNGDLTPDMVTAGSHKKVWWLGKCGHEWQAEIKSRVAGAGCPICSGFKKLIGYNDLATTCPSIAKEWHPTKNGKLTPHDVTKGSDRKVWWLGECGHQWEETIKNRTRFGYGCPICRKK